MKVLLPFRTKSSPSGRAVARMDPKASEPESGSVIARGLVGYDSSDLPDIIGRSTHDLVAERGAGFDREVVHRDDLIVRARKKK